MIQENYKILEEKIAEKCLKTGMNRSDITLIAISKMQPMEMIIEAFNAGIIHFGENKAQELDQKTERITENIIWHFVGHLQTNKVKYVIKSAEYIHSVDSLKLAEEINSKAKRLDKIQKVLLEINTSREASKFGLTEKSEILNISEFCKNSGNLDLIGLMTMAPLTDNESMIRDCFVKLRVLKDELNQKGFGLKELSMGMTNDYEIALEEGATMLRIGTAIFGDRSYN
ncbi:MAG: YggS family pyridoxal phosphate enzyme [Ignavibacteria bacterium RBG_13_36_8]|nr:MAG: YggS family pyridoxal phosphate enzyme [Ignavibacteria bacterium RBG_13_36_8]